MILKGRHAYRYHERSSTEEILWIRSTQAVERGPKRRVWSSLLIGEPIQATEHGSTSKGGCTSGTPDGESMALHFEDDHGAWLQVPA